MKTLALDTSHSYLTIALIEEDQLISSIQKPAFKQQSETIMVEIDRMFKEANWRPTDLQALVLTDGPGSYTGLRISMTVAKVLGLVQGIQLYTISSLQLLAGNQPNIYAVMDARAKRVYLGHYKNGEPVHQDITLSIEEAKKNLDPEAVFVGDAHLLGMKKTEVDCSKHFIQLRSRWIKVDNVHTLVPRYLKETDDYGL
ncbi:MAG: Inactive metal-dependent protease putative molecular chaperone [Erysipelotrichaceae bacterium]|nr:MAG: Inactive metal-dependent protease putative molecular [Erysipelotrichaceae bacterium]TXT19713.1 MAG: Inactive metal-dependent protease putative molecular chaperone [Erysipelotrichaceae bacterium]